MITFNKTIGSKGNSLGTSFPKEILKAMNLEKGDQINLAYNDEEKLITITKS